MKYGQLAAALLCRVRVGERVFLLLITLLAFALRVYRLEAQALWWDESLTVYRATRDLAAVLSNVILIQNVITIDTLPQQYFVVQHFLVRAFGVSEFALRFLSVAANVGTVPLLYVLARRWFNAGIASLSALFGVLSPFYVYYAQEARPYALLLFWSTLAVYALTRALGSRQRRIVSMWVVVYILTAIGSLYTHYYSIFLFPFHVVLIGLLVWEIPRLRWFCLLPALPFASVVVLIPQIAASLAGNVSSGPLSVPLDIILRDLLNSFSVGVTVDLAQIWGIDVALLVLFLIGVTFSNAKFAIRESEPMIANYDLRTAILLLAYICVPIVALQVLSSLRPLYQNSRYLIAISPAFYLGVAAGIVVLARRWKVLAVLAFGVFLVGAVISLNHLYYDPRFGKDDHRAWAESLRERVRPGDFLILDSPHTEELYRYYADDLLPMTTLPILRAEGIASPEADLAVVRDALQGNTRVWFLAMHVPFDDPQRRIEQLLNQKGVLLDHTRFSGTSTEIALSLFVRTFPTASASNIRHPLNIPFGDNLRLLGYDVPDAVESGRRGVVRLYWQVEEPVGEDYAVSLRIVDEAGTRWGQWDSIPLGNRTGSSTWQPRQIVVDVHDLPAVAGTLPGKYRLQVQPYHSATGNPLGDLATFGEIEVTNPR